jgi:hypothetical protein
VPTDPATLPQHNGRAVPWVTRWTNEIHPDRYKYGLTMTPDGRMVLTYGEGVSEDRRDGVLWQREGIQRGGEPDWANVSTYRQRLSMTKRKCQVCGNKIEETPIRWLMPLDGLEQVDADTTVTIQPPTCSDCIPLALELCPRLKRAGYMILKVLDYEVWGVSGHIVARVDDQPRLFQGAVAYDTHLYGQGFHLGQVMAQQQVVRLGKFVVEERVEP